MPSGKKKNQVVYHMEFY